jgi:preprotein translocase subunit SecF
MFQKFKKNILDSLSISTNKMAALNSKSSGFNRTIDSLQSALDSTKTSLAEITRSKDSMKFLGIEVAKGTYNTIMWSVVIGLLLITLIVFLIFKRNQSVIVSRNKDLQDLRTEFEAYRKTSREAREKMALQHFNELKRLRGE